jgi:hypothetical protein
MPATNPICPDCGISIDIGMWPFACAGMGHEPGVFWRSDAQIHSSEKVVVLEGPGGDIKIPGRGDRPLHPKLAAAGYVRHELNSMTEVREVERRTKTIHERSSYDKNSAAADRDTQPK